MEKVLLLNLFGGDEVFASMKNNFPQSLQYIRGAFNCVRERVLILYFGLLKIQCLVKLKQH